MTPTSGKNHQNIEMIHTTQCDHRDVKCGVLLRFPPSVHCSSAATMHVKVVRQLMLLLSMRRAHATWRQRAQCATRTKLIRENCSFSQKSVSSCNSFAFLCERSICRSSSSSNRTSRGLSMVNIIFHGKLMPPATILDMSNCSTAMSLPSLSPSFINVHSASDSVECSKKSQLNTGNALL